MLRQYPGEEEEEEGSGSSEGLDPLITEGHIPGSRNQLRRPQYRQRFFPPYRAGQTFDRRSRVYSHAADGTQVKQRLETMITSLPCSAPFSLAAPSASTSVNLLLSGVIQTQL